MKKFVVILIMLSYVVSVTGLTVSRFYCCGKLKSVKIVFASADNKKGCSAKMDSKKCCKYDKSFFKVNDNHLGSTVEFVPDVPVAEIVYYDANVFLQKQYSSFINDYSNAPPEDLQVPVYLRNRIFRI